jgi:hypothetical protein
MCVSPVLRGRSSVWTPFAFVASNFQALNSEPRNIQAELGLGKFKEALKDFRVAYSLRPNDRDALSKLKHCESMVRRQAFEAAIRTEVKQQTQAPTRGLVHKCLARPDDPSPIL